MWVFVVVERGVGWSDRWGFVCMVCFRVPRFCGLVRFGLFRFGLVPWFWDCLVVLLGAFNASVVWFIVEFLFGYGYLE